jgi:oxalate decarboxylase/phosphoglucose isomerase-like protein (cupin superfamily)
MHTRVSIAAPIARSADLTSLTGLPLTLRAGQARLGPSLLVEEDKVRRLSELGRVTAEPPGRSGRRIEYQMLNGVRQSGDSHLDGLALRYELTAMAGRPIGWEAAKTAGHVHVRPAGSATGYPEIVEVLHGEAGFLIQDLTAGPSGPVSEHAWLVRARPGDWVILPPELAHVTIDLGAGPLVFSDVIDRRATGVYSGVADARGFAWYVGADGGLRANPRYERHPAVIEVSAQDWSGPPAGRLYEVFRDDPTVLSWLSEPSRFPSVAPRVWQRVIQATAAGG